MTDSKIGRALTSAEFAADMARRKAAVDAAQDAKRREKLAKQRAEDAKYAGYEFDTFQYAESHAVRNLSTEGESMHANATATSTNALSVAKDEAAVATAAPAEFVFQTPAELLPVNMPGLQRHTFTCRKEPAAVFTAIVRGLEKMQAKEEREARAAADAADTFDMMDVGEGCAFVNDEADEEETAEALKTALPIMNLASADDTKSMAFKAKPASWKINVNLPCNGAGAIQLAICVFKSFTSEQHAVVHVTRRAGPSLHMNAAMSTVENLVLDLISVDTATDKGDILLDARESQIRREIESL